jgi:tetratricopeptide (TPR) repeat protein
VLVQSGVTISPAELEPQVYVPGRKGSFQVELLAATRRQGRVAYVLKPELRALIEEVAQRPVVVLQNLGLEALPRWHFAVVVGYDAGNDSVILRSGTERRQVMTAHEFLRSWALGSQWAMVALLPGELPATDDPDAYVRAVAALEAQRGSTAVTSSYAAAVKRWPGHRLARLGLANALQAEGRVVEAVAEFESLAAQTPSDPVVLNNLADGLLKLGCRDRALEIIERASRAQPEPGRIRAAIEATRREIEASPAQAGAACAPTEGRP